jgi:hypothetical protein
MADRWYYAHDINKFGPFSDRQLIDLALSGTILRTDTIWKDGIENGVLATKVQYLFPAASAQAFPVGNRVPPSDVHTPATADGPSSMGTPTAAGPSSPPHSSTRNLLPTEWGRGNSAEEANSSGQPPAQLPEGEIALLPETDAPVAPSQKSPQQHPKPKRRAVGVKGVVIVGQDGANVKFRKKCTACGFEDSSWNTVPITIGSIKVTFFCPKCRKRQSGEMRGSQQ